ncbi:MAG: M42 family peptidase [Oscillospiraceae bacterium]
MVKQALLEQLCNISGTSGDEDRVADFITQQIKDHCTYKIDTMGSIIAYKKGKKTPKNKLLLSSHMDEVGFIITYITDKGYLKFATCGGIDTRVMIGKTIQIGNTGIQGIIGVKPVHLTTDKDREKPIELDKLYIDIGANNKEEAQKFVSIGNRGVFVSAFTPFGDGLLKAKALDDRAGCAMLITLIQSNLEYDCYFAFTVQEESGCSGAGPVAFDVDPDYAIIVETTTASDIPDIDPHKVVCTLGNGPVISFMDRGTVYDMEFYNTILNIAKEQNIPHQSKMGVFGGNESKAIQVSKTGVKVSAISLACRYLHSANTVLKETDISSTLQLLNAVILQVADR